MFEIKIVENHDDLVGYKAEYLQRTTAPLDGMWLNAFVPMSTHFGFYRDSQLCGYCCVNDDGFVLQFHMASNDTTFGSSLLSDLAKGTHEISTTNISTMINGAFVSTAEPAFLSLCFDNFGSFNVNALMFALEQVSPTRSDANPAWKLTPLCNDDLSTAVEFVLRNLDFPKEWLTGYFSNLIDRQELFGCRLDGKLIGTGERRKSEGYQSSYTDLGVIVDKQHQRQGMATWILQQLATNAIEAKLKPICSTEQSNPGAQTAITRAGFVSRNRIIQFNV